MNAKPIEREISDDEYMEYLDGIYGDIDTCGMTYNAGYVLKELDPIAFICGKNDYESDLLPDEWECGLCGKIFDDEDEAEECCQEDEDEDEDDLED